MQTAPKIRHTWQTLFACFYATLAGLPGCASLDALGVERPTAAVRSMNVTSVTAEGFTMDFDVDVTNPNTFALPLTNTTNTVSLAGVETAAGSLQPQGSIAADATGNVRLPVTVTYQQMLDTGRALLESGGNVPYRFDASLGTNTDAFGGLLAGLGGEDGLRVPLQYEGTLDMAALLRNPAALNSPIARRFAREALGNLLGF